MSDWQTMDITPPGPVQVELFYGKLPALTDQYNRPVELPPYRDCRRCLAYWDGEAWRELGTGHDVYEFKEDQPDVVPTHWRALPPVPA